MRIAAVNAEYQKPKKGKKLSEIWICEHIQK